MLACEPGENITEPAAVETWQSMSANSIARLQSGRRFDHLSRRWDRLVGNRCGSRAIRRINFQVRDDHFRHGAKIKGVVDALLDFMLQACHCRIAYFHLLRFA